MKYYTQKQAFSNEREFMISKFSTKYKIKQLQKADIPALLQLCQGNPTYYQYMKMEPTLENLSEELTALPPGKALEDKYFVGFYQSEELVAVLDLIAGYPDENTAYIGWFILDKAYQRKGIGSGIMSELLAFLKKEGFQFVRLGCIKGNLEGTKFWLQNGFLPTGDETETESYTVVVMQREL